MEASRPAADAHGRGFASSIRPGEEPGSIVRVGEEDVSVSIEEKLERADREETRILRLNRFTSERDLNPPGRLVLRIDHAYLDGVRSS